MPGSQNLLELKFLSFRTKGLDTMFCLIWYGLVTDFTSRIFKSLPHFRQFCPFYGLLCKQATRALGAFNLGVESEERGRAYDVTSSQTTSEVNRMGENGSFILTCYIKTVSVYDFKLVWVILHLPVKEFFKTIY